MLSLALLACSKPAVQTVEAAPSPPSAIPEIEPSTPSTPAAQPTVVSGLPLEGPISRALAVTPHAIAGLYALSLSKDKKELTVDPARTPRAVGGARRSAGYTAKDSANGGKIIQLDGGPFDKGLWVRGTLAYFVPDPTRRARLTEQKFDLNVERDLLVVTAVGSSDPTMFAFSADRSSLGMVGICDDVTVLDFKTPSAAQHPPMVVRKPVIYLYPEKPMQVRVDVQLRGDFVVRYPAMEENGWTVHASPDGRLQTPDGRSHRYLFWEGEGAKFSIDPAEAHCIAGEDTVSFLEETCAAFALTDLECGDFVTYWLPSMSANPYNLITFPAEAYGHYATLEVEPEPDTVIRAFMAFRGVDAPVEVGSPALPKHERSGFTVVEWGGVDLGTQSPGSAK